MSEFLHATDKAAKSLKWTSLIEILSRTATPIVFVVLATLLQPTDFGLLATASIVVSFVQIFIDSGLGRALIQFDSSSLEETANTAFWLNMMLGLILYGAMNAAAPWVAAAFQEQALVAITRVLGLQIVLSAVASVPQALLQRNFDFKRLLVAKLASAFVPGAVSVVLALKGYGVWSLVFGSLLTAAINSIVIFASSSWKPSLRISWSAASPILHFGGWTLLEGLATWFLLWGDNLIVVSFLGVDQLGVYRVACNIALVLFTIALNPLISVLYPYLSRLNGDFRALRDVFTKLNRLVTALTLPLALGLLLVAPAMVQSIFGNRWMGLGLVLALISLREGISWLAGISPELYRAVGRPDINVKAILITICLYLPAYLLAAPHGLYVFATVRIVVTVASLLVHVLFTTRLLKIPTSYLWTDSRSVGVACAAMCAVVLGSQALLVRMSSVSLIPSTIMMVVLGMAAYVIVLRKVDGDLVSLAARLLNRAAG
jgi:O-antigen/teichoic acid export membrane protein